MTTLIVTAADETYVALLLDLLHSLRPAKAAGYRIGCLDLGLSISTRTLIAPLLHEIVKPEWPFRLHATFDSRPYYLSRAIRPFLPRYFPGHDTYIWLDADCWVQDQVALEHLVHTARGGCIVAVTAADRSYIHADESRRWVERRYQMAFGSAVAEQLRPYNYINSGVVALKATAPHWQVWQARFQDALDRWEGDFLCDQAVLNVLIYLDQMPSVLLPAEYNWICHLRYPEWSQQRRQFINPNFPWTGIGIVHNTLNEKQKVLTLASDTEGGSISTCLTYTGYEALAKRSQLIEG